MKENKLKGPLNPSERANRLLFYIGIDAGIKDVVQNISEALKEGNKERTLYCYEVLYHLTIFKVGP